MYVERVQILNYGPIDNLDINLPFNYEERPKPVLLIGENGSGKSIVLSHIVNGLISAKDVVYPYSPEIAENRVYKLSSSSYIKVGREFYFARVDFEDSLFIGELRTRENKTESNEPPEEICEHLLVEEWKGIATGSNDNPISNLRASNPANLRELFAKNCALYFPPNRFEDPAWLNEDSLNSQANYMELRNL